MTIKLGVLVRTRDEEHRIRQFCESYKDADKILVADGGSVDRTIEYAKEFSNVEIRDFTERTIMKNGYWRNNDSDHVNFLIRWSKEYDFTFVILDDCDCRPNYLLKRDYRKIFEETDCDFVMAVRFYLWRTEFHFPHMCKPGSGNINYEPSLWAWRGNQDFWTVDVPPAFTFRIGNMPVKDLRKDAKTLEIFPPYALIHFSWDDSDRVNQKVKVYRESGLIPGQLHPLKFAGPLELLPEFIHE